MTARPMSPVQGWFGGMGDGLQGPGTLVTVARVACGRGSQVYTAEDLPGRGQSWNGATMTYVAQIDTGIHDVSDSFDVASSPLDGSVAIVSHGPANSPGNYIQWFQENLTWIRKVGTGGSVPGSFRELEGVAFDSAGNLYTWDTFNGIQKWTSSGTLVGLVGLQGAESDTVILSDGVRCVANDGGSGAAIWGDSFNLLVNLKDETGATAEANAWHLSPGTGSGNYGNHIYTTQIFTTALSSTKVWKYTQDGTLVATYYLDLSQAGASGESLQRERPFAFATSGDETTLYLGTQPQDAFLGNAWVYKFLFPPDDAGAAPFVIAGRGAC